MSTGLGGSDRVFGVAVLGVGAVWLVLTLGAWLAFTVSGRRPTAASMSAPLVALAYPADVGAAWGSGAPSVSPRVARPVSDVRPTPFAVLSRLDP